MTQTRIVERRNIIPANVAQARAWTTGNSIQTLAGDKRLLLLIYGKETTDVAGLVTAATLNGVAGTVYAESSIDTGFAASISFIYWDEIALQSIGIGTFVSTITSNGTLQAADGEMFISQMFTGVDQANPFTDNVSGSVGGDGAFTYPDIVRNEGSYLIAGNSSGNSAGVATPPANFTTVATIAASSSDLQAHESFGQNQYNESATFVGTGNNRIAYLMAALQRSEAA